MIASIHKYQVLPKNEGKKNNGKVRNKHQKCWNVDFTISTADICRIVQSDGTLRTRRRDVLCIYVQ